MNTSDKDIFIDTSILVYRLLRAQSKRQQVKRQLSGKRVITCAVVLQEYKGLVLREAPYLIQLFQAKETIWEVRDHVINVLQKQQERKMKICLDILNNLIGDLPAPEQKEIAITYLHSFIQNGMRAAQQVIDQEFDTIECACAKYKPEVITPYKKYDFGPIKCKTVRADCGIISFMDRNKRILLGLLDFLSNRSRQFTEEMKKIYEFLERTKDHDVIAPDFNPCLTLGDLLIALESRDIKNFYTGNFKESRFFCEHFNQNLIVSSHNPEHDDRTFSIDGLPWNFS